MIRFCWPCALLLRYAKALSGIVMGLALTACAVGPDYQRPDIDVGTAYKSAEQDPANQGWVIAQPQDDAVRTDWWTLFNDPQLDAMMVRLLEGNFDLAQAQAQYRQARAALQATRAGYFPTVGTSASASRSGSGAGTSSGNAMSLPGRDRSVQSQYSVSADVSWEIDLWGRIQRSVEGSQAGLQASAADVANTQLSLQSTLAQTYFRLRALDIETDLMQRTVAAYQRSLDMTQNRLDAGVAAPADVAVSTTQLENARAQLQGLHWQRAQLEHALAVLQGVAPSHFDIDPSPRFAATAPVIPAGIPAQLLQRRPDVAAAERRTQQANADIGVARAAWFPDLTLSAQGGFRSGQWAQWLTAPAQFWSLGPALALTLFDGGARRARVDEAQAGYDAQVASYRQTVLTALNEVEDVMVQLDSLDTEIALQQRALAAARESLALTRNQYDAGMIDYLSVVQVETAALNAERTALDRATDKLTLTVQLIAALGGGWEGQTAPY